MSFPLHPQLEKDCHRLGSLELSSVLLLNEMRYPWIILVPERPGLRELIDLSVEDRLQLLEESSLVQEVLLELFRP
jgi:diadenosine tetraphosphate (Ap4A) HIT family hydrolase